MKKLLIVLKSFVKIDRGYWLQTYFSKEFLALSLLFVVTRLYNLTLLPIFTDESIYIYWAKFIGSTYSYWFISLTDGKPPLFIWIMTFFLKIFPSSFYLIVGRLVSVLAGAITAFGVYKLTHILFNSKKTAFFAVFLCLINPFMLFYDRLALYDAFLTAMLVWGVYFTIKTTHTYKKIDAFFWGLFLGLGLLTKPPAVIFIPLTFICFFILIFKKNIKKQIKKIWFLPFIAIAVAEGINSIQRLSLSYQVVAQKNERFQLPLNEFFSAPFTLIYKNSVELFQWIVSYNTIPIFLLGFAAMIFLLVKDTRKGLILFMLWIIPILVFATVGKILFPRYILFTTPFFLIALSQIAHMFFTDKHFLKLKIAFVIFLLSFSLYFDFMLLTNPPKAPLLSIERYQYISSQYSGYGLSSIFSFLDTELERGPRITLVTQGKFGLFPYAFTLKYWNDPRIDIIPTWIPENLEYDLYSFPTKTYVVFREEKTIPEGFSLYLVLKAEKPRGEYPILLTGLRDKK